MAIEEKSLVDLISKKIKIIENVTYRDLINTQ